MRRRTLRQQDLEKLRDGEELHEAVENDPAYLEVAAHTHLEHIHTHMEHTHTHLELTNVYFVCICFYEQCTFCVLFVVLFLFECIYTLYIAFF